MDKPIWRWPLILAALLALASLVVAGLTKDSARPYPVAESAPEAAIDWQVPRLIDRGPLVLGPWMMNESDWRYVDDAAVAISDDGVVAVTWVDQARKAVLLQVFEPDGAPRLAKPIDVSRSPRIFSWLPRVALGDEQGGTVFVLWQEIVFSGGSHGGEIFFSRSLDGGHSSERPLNLSNTQAGAGKGRLTADHWHNGSLELAVHGSTLYAAWTEYEGRLHVSRSTDFGASFSPPLHVAGDHDQPARGPALAASGNQVHLAWAVGESDTADIHYARSNDRGLNFQAPRTLFSGAGHADAPSLAIDKHGGLHLAYAESASGPGGHYRVLYTRSADSGQTFTEPKTLPSDDSASTGFPVLALSGERKVYLLWERMPADAPRPRGLGLSLSPDGGHSFTPAQSLKRISGNRRTVNGSYQGLFSRKLAVNASAEIAIVNSVLSQDGHSQVWLLQGHHVESIDDDLAR